VLVTKTNGQHENAFPATVREVNFSGATSTVKLDANGLLVEALALDANGFRVGEQRVMVLPPERIALLKNE
jgi:hypothetical protein